MSSNLKKGLLAGKKINGNHSTVIEAAREMVLAAKNRPEVRKVVLGVVSKIGPGKSRVKFKRIQAGLQMTVRGGASMQEFYIYTSDPALTQSHLAGSWQT